MDFEDELYGTGATLLGPLNCLTGVMNGALGAKPSSAEAKVCLYKNLASWICMGK